MDVCKLEKAVGKQSTTVSLRQPLVSADNKNGDTRRSRTREVSFRYLSPTPSATSVPKRCPSPNARRLSSTSTASLPKRAISVERKRPSTPSTPPSPSLSTMIQNKASAVQLTPRKASINNLPESLWPSTIRSLRASFQGDAFSVPIDKKEKTIPCAPSDRTLKPSSNVARKGETPLGRKPTPEKRRSPLKGKNSADQLENSKPVDSLPPHLLDQHRWPNRTTGRTSSISRTSDVTEKVNKTPLSHSRMVVPPLRRLSLDGTSKPLQRSANDILMPASHVGSGKEMFYGSLFHDGSQKLQRLSSSSSFHGGSQKLQGPSSSSSFHGGSQKLQGPSSSSSFDGSQKLQRPSSSSSSERTYLMNAAAGTRSLSNPRSRPSSPSVSRGASPSRGRIATPSSRGSSPARVRPSSPSRQPQDIASVLSFIAGIRKSKKVAGDIEDVHQLRLYYNRHLQWQYANARTGAAMHYQKAKAEKILYSIWRIILDLSNSVRKKRSNLQQLKLKLKLYSVLVNQARCLDEWASVEKDHANSFTWAIQDLQASTLRIPVTEGTRVDIRSFKEVLHSAVDVMMAMGPSSRSILPQVEGVNSLVSELSDVAARERGMLNECESIFDSIAAFQVEEDSLRTHLLQKKRAWRGRGDQNQLPAHIWPLR